MSLATQEPTAATAHRTPSDLPFYLGLGLLGGVYVVLLLALLAADIFFTTPDHLWQALQSREVRYAIKLSLLSCSLTTILALWVAVPIGYLMSRHEFRGKHLLDALFDIPIVLPPLVLGLSLLLLFQSLPGRWFQQYLTVTYAIPAVVLAQFVVASAFAIRAMRVTFDQISPRQEQVALTLGCSKSQAFWLVVLPQAKRGVVTAATLAWARSLGEFGPILVFAGTTRFHTEVLATTVFLELGMSRIDAAVAVSLLMVGAAVAVLVILRVWGMDPLGSNLDK